MTVRHKLAAALPFAHLLGMGIRAEDDESRRGKRARRAEEDDDRDDEDGRRAEERDDKDDKNGKKGKRARRADEDDGEEDGDEEGRRAEEDEGEEDDGGDRDDKDGKKGKKAKRARRAEDDEHAEEDDEDDDESEMRGNGSRAQARRRERARCSAIFSCAAAAINPAAAANLAFNTAMPRSQAIAVLQSIASGTPARPAGASGRQTLDQRMAAAQVPSGGADGGSRTPSGMSKTAAAIVAAAEKAQRR